MTPITNLGKPKKIVYTTITIFIIILATLTILLNIADKKHDKNSIITDTSAPPENTDKNDVSVTSEMYEEETLPSAVTDVVDTTETTQESTIESATETYETENNDISPFIKQLKDIETTYRDTVLALTEDMGDEYLSRIIFLGDSTTYGLKKYGMLPGGSQTKNVWTPVSGTLTLAYATFSTILYPDDGSEIIITDAVTKSKPDILVVTLGINGISFMDETYFKSEYIKLVQLIQKASPYTKIILQSIFPVAKSYVNKKSINNEKITASNLWIAEVANKTGVKYANTASVLMDKNGYLPEEYQNGDGLHLNEISFAIELEYLRTHAYPEEPVITEIVEKITEVHIQ